MSTPDGLCLCMVLVIVWLAELFIMMCLAVMMVMCELGVVPDSNSDQTALLIGSISGGVGVLILLACIVYFRFGSQCVKQKLPKHTQTSQQKEEPRLDIY
jgi:hypothetical protein